MAYHFSERTVRFGLDNEEYARQKWIPLCFSGEGASAGCAGKERQMGTAGMETGAGKKKSVWIAAAVILIILLGIIFFVNRKGSEASAAELSFTEMELTDTGFTAKAEFMSSGKSCRRYSYVIEKGVLYLTVYGGLAGGRYSDGSFTVDIQDDLKDVFTVCLKGCDDTAVLYTR